MELIVKLGGAAAIAALAMGVMSGIGYRFGWWDLGFAFFKLMAWSLYAGGAAAGVGVVGLIFSRQRVMSLCVLIVGGGVAIAILMQVMAGRSVPAIHDITTDTENPPEFVEIVALRGEGSNSLDYANKQAPVARGSTEMKSNRELQEGYYTDIKPLNLEMGTTPCFDMAAEVAGKQGWEMVNVDAEALIIEATDTTFWYGFKDDVVIRISGDAMSCRVDMRSVSRVGMSDVGVNAKRIRSYMAALVEEAS